MKERERHHHGVTEAVTGLRSEVASTLRLAVPLVGAQIAAVAMAATDTAFLGRLGTDALGGGGLAASIQVTTQLVASGFLTVIAPLAAHARARRDDAALAAVMRHGLIAAVVFGIAAAVVVANVAVILKAIGEPDSVIAAAAPFARAVAWSTPFLLVSSVFRHVLTASERPRIIAATSVGAAIANAALDALLIDRLGAAGVGFATTVVSAGSSIILGIAAARHVAPRSVIRLEVDRAMLREILRLGGPAAMMIGAEVAVFQLAGLVVAKSGAVALAAHQMALTVVTLAFVVPLGISQAVAVRVATAEAMGGHIASRSAANAGLALGAAFAISSAAALLAAPGALARLFIRDDVATVSVAVGIFRIAAAFQLFDAAQVIAAGALRGLRDTKAPAAIGVTAYVVVAPIVAWGVAAGATPGVLAVWIGLAASLACAAVGLVARLVRLTRHP